jgi:hypothetical protein
MATSAVGITGKWLWVGKPLAGNPEYPGRKYYKAAVKIFSDAAGQAAQESLQVKVGDIVCMKVGDEDEDDDTEPEPWVAHCVELCELGSDEEIPFGDVESGLDTDDKLGLMRVGVRWLYRPKDFDAENEDGKVPMNPSMERRELLWTDGISGPLVNSVDVIDGIASLFGKASECNGKERAYFCHRFFHTLEYEDQIMPPDVVPKHLQGVRVRDVSPLELEKLKSKPSTEQNWFWREQRKHRAKKSTSSLSGLKRRSESNPEASLVKKEKAEPDNTLAPAVTKKRDLADTSLEGALPQNQLVLLRENLRNLTAEQVDVLVSDMPEFVEHITKEIAHREEPITKHAEYEKSRDDAVASACTSYWERVLGGSAG